MDKWKHLATQECDLNILTEHNKYMDFPDHETLESLTRGWWNGTMCRSMFLREPNRELRTLRQPGGVALIANGKCTSHIISQGNNERKLGWRWITLLGKDQLKFVVGSQ